MTSTTMTIEEAKTIWTSFVKADPKRSDEMLQAWIWRSDDLEIGDLAYSPTHGVCRVMDLPADGRAKLSDGKLVVVEHAGLRKIA